jgi:AcrR family transcriptional regulator
LKKIFMHSRERKEGHRLEIRENTPSGERLARAERILDAAADLLLRWGYKRVTMEEIAKRAGVGTGTIYLHWKTKETIFETVMLREAVAVWRTMLQRIEEDVEEVLLHRLIRAIMLIAYQRPLARALFTKDSEMLGKLAQGGLPAQVQNTAMPVEFIALLRDLGLMRTDMELDVQMYAFSATVTGFSLVDPLLTEKEQIPLEKKAEAIAQTIHRAFEPDELPSRATLQERVMPMFVGMLTQVCEYCDQQIQARMH